MAQPQQQFGTKDYTDIDRIRDIIGRVSQADLRQRLYVADQERAKQERSQISDVLDSYSRAISGKTRSTQTGPMSQFGIPGGMQDVEEPVSADEERSQAATAVSRLSAIGGPQAKIATDNLLEMRKGNINEEDRDLNRKLKQSMFNDQMTFKKGQETAKQANEAEKRDIDRQKLEIANKRNEITASHNKAMEDLKRDAANVLSFDENGKITINPNAKATDVVKIYPTYLNAITSGIMRMAFTDPADTAARAPIQESIKQLQGVSTQLGDLISRGLDKTKAPTTPKRIKVKLKKDIGGHKAGTKLEIDEADFDPETLEKIEDGGSKK